MRFFPSILLFVLISTVHGQSMYLPVNTNMDGVTAVFFQPAAGVSKRIKLDAQLYGAGIQFNNSWFAIKKEALNYSGSIFKPSTVKLPASWKTPTPNIPDNIFKNFVVVGHPDVRTMRYESRLFLPSFLWQIDSKSSVAFLWSVRQMVNITGLQSIVAALFESEMDLNLLQNHHNTNDRFSAVQATWAEYGLSYSRVVLEKDRHTLKAGVTPKILSGQSAGYVIINDLDFYFSTVDSNSYFKSGLITAHSDRFTTGFKALPGLASRVSPAGLGLDLGVMYELATDNSGSPSTYRLKAGASITDIGKIRFNTSGSNYEMDINIRDQDIRDLITRNNLRALDSLLHVKFKDRAAPSKFDIILPTAVNLQADVWVVRHAFIGIQTQFYPFAKNNQLALRSDNIVSLAPRWEMFWWSVSTPVTYDALSAERGKPLSVGLVLRAGPLMVGTGNLFSWSGSSVTSGNFFASLKLTIPQKKDRDSDGDGVPDKIDDCPKAAGDKALGGCPDSDKDGVPDSRDACPHQQGLEKFRGCQDRDGDDVGDADDLCPDVKGSKENRGCPGK